MSHQPTAKSQAQPTATTAHRGTDVASGIARYLDQADCLKLWATGLSAQQLAAAPVAGAWSMHTLICHMLDSELAAVHRMRRIAAEELPLLIAYDETAFAARLPYAAQSAHESAELFAALRHFHGNFLQALPAAAFARAGVHNHRGRITLAEMVSMYVEHVDHHEKFAKAKRAALGCSA